MPNDTFSISVSIAAPPATVWAVITDGARWPEWTPTVISVVLLDPPPVVLGSRVRIRQPRLPPAIWRVTELREGSSFTWETRSPGVRVIAQHGVESGGDGGSVATLSIRFEGFLGPFAGWLTRGLNTRYLALEAAGLKRRCEAVLLPGGP